MILINPVREIEGVRQQLRLAEVLEALVAVHGRVLDDERAPVGGGELLRLGPLLPRRRAALGPGAHGCRGTRRSLRAR